MKPSWLDYFVIAMILILLALMAAFGCRVYVFDECSNLHFSYDEQHAVPVEVGRAARVSGLPGGP